MKKNKNIKIEASLEYLREFYEINASEAHTLNSLRNENGHLQSMLVKLYSKEKHHQTSLTKKIVPFNPVLSEIDSNIFDFKTFLIKKYNTIPNKSFKSWHADRSIHAQIDANILKKLSYDDKLSAYNLDILYLISQIFIELKYVPFYMCGFLNSDLLKTFNITPQPELFKYFNNTFHLNRNLTLQEFLLLTRVALIAYFKRSNIISIRPQSLFVLLSSTPTSKINTDGINFGGNLYTYLDDILESLSQISFTLQNYSGKLLSYSMYSDSSFKVYTIQLDINLYFLMDSYKLISLPTFNKNSYKNFVD